MSDASVLSHEYKTASELSQAITDALIALKKVRLQLPGSEAIAVDELESSRRRLAEIVEALGILLKPGADSHLESTAATRVPGALVSRLRRERQGDLDYYLDDLKQLAAHLRQESTRLSERDLDLLDQLAAAADAETSSVFRRLMRTRR